MMIKSCSCTACEQNDGSEGCDCGEVWINSRGECCDAPDPDEKEN